MTSLDFLCALDGNMDNPIVVSGVEGRGGGGGAERISP